MGFAYAKAFRPLESGRYVMKHSFGSTIRTDYGGLQELIGFFKSTASAFAEDIEVDFSSTAWFDANLTALLGAFLDQLKNGLNEPHLSGLSVALKTILSKNHFLGSFDSSKPTPDWNATTINYRRFNSDDTNAFKAYLDGELFSRSDLPTISAPLKKRISESILELFVNASTHAGSDFVYSAGQFYPKKGRLDLSVVNLGRSIQANVESFLKKKIGGVESIEWAVQEGHTTRTGNIPGGLGLSTLREFLKLNKGKLQFASGYGYWCETAGKKFTKTFGNRLRGTFVNLEINMNDTTSYILSSEKNNKREQLF